MSADRPHVQARRTAPHGCPRLVLDIERVLDVSARQAIRAVFGFDPKAPWVVCVEFRIEGGPRVVWRIGRDLLQQGLHSMSGLGDVQIWPAHLEERATVWLRLTAGDMAALFELPVAPLAQWLKGTYELVPAGDELAGFDWDMAAADLLRQPRAQSD